MGVEYDEELYLTDLIDVATLQRIQDAFSDLTGLAALTTDYNGKPVTKGSNFTDFCMNYTRQSEEGRKRCEYCDKYGAEVTLRDGKAVSYCCHAGLVDFAAPIMAKGKMIGSFIGGQVLTEVRDYSEFASVAQELGINPDEYVSAAKSVNLVSRETVQRAADFLFNIASVLSDIAYGRYMQKVANREIERAANMKADFLANMSHEIRTPMNAVIGMAEMALREDLPPNAREYIHQIKSSGNALLTIINDILDFSKIESG
ncbi:MAG: PocR ligand-binding domain-containing protein, partial [Wujia sp.]